MRSDLRLEKRCCHEGGRETGAEAGCECEITGGICKGESKREIDPWVL